MKHEKIFKRPDGSRVKVQVSLYLDSARDQFFWNDGAGYCPPDKRKFLYNTGNAATPAEILQTKMELWQKIKPE